MMDEHWQDLTWRSEQQREEIKGLLDTTLEEVKEAQIGREIKVKMWDEMMQTMNAQQRRDLIEKLRMKVGDAEIKRVGAQVSAGYDLTKEK
jgi:hypothetical protein